MKDGHKVKSMSFSKHTYMQTDREQCLDTVDILPEYISLKKEKKKMEMDKKKNGKKDKNVYKWAINVLCRQKKNKRVRDTETDKGDVEKSNQCLMQMKN